MAVSRLLAGAVLIDGNQVLLLDGVGTYSRYPSIDDHYEKVQPTQESLIPDFTSQYPNMLKIAKIYVDNSEKLVIGTKTFNILTISSIRIDDSKIVPEIGSLTKQFTLSKGTRIFLSISLIQLFTNNLKSSNGKVLHVGINNLVHIRQLRSKSYQITFSLSKLYNVFTQDVIVQPFTIYILLNRAKSDNDCILGSKVMLVKDAYYFDSLQGIHRRIPIEPTTKHRNKLLQYFDLLCTNRIHKADLFARFTRIPFQQPDASTQLIRYQRPAPNFNAIITSELQDGTALICMSIKWLRLSHLEILDNLPDTYPRASKASW
jgi:hypothetical protein